MTATDENVKILSRAVLGEVRDSAEKILTEARLKADHIRKQAIEQAALERAKIMDQAALEAERVRSQAVAITQLKARTLELEQREKLLVNVFEAARQKLPELQKAAGYDQIAERLLREALQHLGSTSVKVLADQQTQTALSSGLLEKISSETKIKIRLGEALAQGIGVIVETEDGRRQYDNTLETRLKRMQDTLRTPVYHILMGEPV
jgi:vacuolar-type H+-ATPase subunit E/Vma4